MARAHIMSRASETRASRGEPAISSQSRHRDTRLKSFQRRWISRPRQRFQSFERPVHTTPPVSLKRERADSNLYSVPALSPPSADLDHKFFAHEFVACLSVYGSLGSTTRRILLYVTLGTSSHGAC